MSTARNRHSVRRAARVRVKTKEKKSGAKSRLITLSIILLIPLAIFFWLKTTTRYWREDQKLSVAIDKGDDGVDVVVFDPISSGVTVVNVPASTEVDVARNLGKWRLKSVSKLGEKEGYDKLLAETLTKHLRFPVHVWAESEAEGLVEADFSKLFETIFSSYKTNLGLGDRLRVFYFSLTVKNFKKDRIDLAATRYLKATTLSDGEEGYVVTGAIPTSLSAVFADPGFSQEFGRTKIVDHTEDGFIGKRIGEIVEVIGLKVTSVNHEQQEDFACKVEGKSERAVSLIAKLFDCEELVNSQLEHDVIITIGTEFEDRF